MHHALNVLSIRIYNLSVSNAVPCLQVAAPSPARAKKSGLLFDVEDEDDDGDFLSAAAFKSSAR